MVFIIFHTLKFYFYVTKKTLLIYNVYHLFLNFWGLRLFKRLRLLFFKKLYKAMFIWEATFIRDLRVSTMIQAPTQILFATLDLHPVCVHYHSHFAGHYLCTGFGLLYIHICLWHQVLSFYEYIGSCHCHRLVTTFLHITSGPPSLSRQNGPDNLWLYGNGPLVSSSLCKNGLLVHFS